MGFILEILLLDPMTVLIYDSCPLGLPVILTAAHMGIVLKWLNYILWFRGHYGALTGFPAYWEQEFRPTT